MNDNRSVATIDAPEFINLEQDALNPGISKCEIKVFYLGKNRNGSEIDRSTAIQMANSLPGTPIVGVWYDSKDDFGDHGQTIHIEDGEVTFDCKTVPYGFIAPDSKIWFKKFVDTEDDGTDVIHEYLMAQGYLWTGQYPEVLSAVASGKGQSMELDDESMKGQWSTDRDTGIEFFIINDAVFNKLCILGDDVEPCFEGAAVTKPEISATFSKQEFSRSLFSMMNELKNALQNKGGSDMPTAEFAAAPKKKEVAQSAASDDQQKKEQVAKAAAPAPEQKKEQVTQSAAKKQPQDETQKPAEKPVEEKTPAKSAPASEGKPATDDEQTPADEKKKPAAKSSLEARFEALQAEVEELRAYKLAEENKQKDALINKYHMLSREDKAEIVAHKGEYSLDEIDAKLAQVYVHKNVDFSTVDGKVEADFSFEEPQEEVSTTFSLDNDVAGFVPPIVEALRQTKTR